MKEPAWRQIQEVIIGEENSFTKTGWASTTVMNKGDNRYHGLGNKSRNALLEKTLNHEDRKVRH